MAFSSFKETPHNRETNKRLVKILHNLLEAQDSVPFRKPVPYIALGLEDYRKVIKKPMDLNQVRRNNNENKYRFLEEALDDIQLCWKNCLRYNNAESSVYKQAITLQDKFWVNIRQNFGSIYDQIEEKVRDRSQSDQINIPSYTGNYQLPAKSKQNNKSNGMHSQNSSHLMQVQSKQENNDGMQQQQNQSEHISKEPNSQQQSQHLVAAVSHKQPIEINLNEKPTKQMIETLNQHMRQKMQDKQMMEQVLEILMGYEKEKMVKDDNGDINFDINQIHITTYFRICKVIKLELQESLQIIE